MISKLYNEASKVWIDISKGQKVSFLDFQKGASNLSSIFHVGPYYYYFFDLTTAEFLYVSPEIKEILGYKNTEISVRDFLSYIHPEDAPYFLKFEEKVSEFYARLHIEQVLKYKVSYDYRVKNKSGDYIRILHQVICVKHCNQGNVLQTLGVHTNINHIKPDGTPNLSFIGLNKEPSFYDIEIDTLPRLAASKNIFTKRELEIIRLIANGMSTLQIAETLFISEYTVGVHRKNILRKWKNKSMTQLISEAVKSGWI